MNGITTVRILVIGVTFFLAVMVIKNLIETSDGMTLFAGVILVGFIAFRIIIHNIRKLMRGRNQEN